MKNQSRFKRNEFIAYEGSIGKIRQQFCIEYIEHKKKIIALMGQSLSGEAAFNGESISCSKGCTSCCSNYITASLQECEAIVYWLYQHRETLARFLTSYESWRECVNNIEPVLQIMNSESEGQAVGATPQLKSAIDDYRRQKISCPFLYEDACSIYEVRPWVCAGLVSVSLKEWCDISNPSWDKLKTYRFDTYATFEKPFYLKLDDPIHLGCLPEMVHALLEDGFDFLARYPGFERITDNCVTESEVMEALQVKDTPQE